MRESSDLPGQPSPRRALENERLFRRLNHKIEEHARLEDDAGDPDPRFFCECADDLCRERIALAPTEFAAAHKTQLRFIVLPGHEVPDVEQVVETHAGYYVVEKTRVDG